MISTGEHLYVILDINLKILARTPHKLQIMLDSIWKFLNAFYIQSSQNQYQIYAAIGSKTHLI